MSDPPFEINLDESFETLSKAPIAEAVMDWRAQPAKRLDPQEYLAALQERLPDYPTVQPQHEMLVDHEVGPQGSKLSHSHSWQAFQFRSSDQLNVARFGRGGLAVSRLAPYENWDAFRKEAMRLWDIFLDLASPPEVQRVGLRYVNLLPVESLDKVNLLLCRPLTFPGSIDLPPSQVMHQEGFHIPGRDYGLNLIRMVQPTPDQANHALNLIVDIDVFTTSENVEGLEASLESILSELRWIKNKAFFSVFTEQALGQFRE